MAEEEQDQRTESPTGKRLGEAREKGQLPISREVSNFVLFLGILVVVAWLAPMMTTKMIPTLRVFLEQPHEFSLTENGLQGVFFETVKQIGMACILVFAMMCTAAILGTMLQTGFFASLETIRPNFERLNPATGLKRVFSKQALVDLGKSFGKLVVLGGLVFMTILPVVKSLPAFNGLDLMGIVELIHREAVHLIIIVLMAFLVIAIIDLVYQRYTYTKSLRMTKQEVKDEFKQQEGDPMIKNRLRQIRIEKARKRMMAQVPKADVVITNPTHYAIALQYDNTKMAAPVVLAKGLDAVAERIRDVALEHKIPLVSNPPLARALYDTVELDQQIPTQHYRAVAEVISFVYKLRKRRVG